MVYYFSDTFSPFTKQHYMVLDFFCKALLEGHDGLMTHDAKDKIMILVKPLEDEKHSGIAGHQLCSSEEYREKLIGTGLCYLKNNYPELKDSFDIQYLGKEDENDFVENYCSEHELNGFRNIMNHHFVGGYVVEIGLRNASIKVRDIFYRNPYTNFDDVKQYLLKGTFDEIKSWHHYWQGGYEDEYRRDETVYIKDYKEHELNKYQKPSATVCLIVIRSANKVIAEGEVVSPDEILLVRRKNFPYRKFWSLPGGFLDLNEDETLEDAASRELMEETELYFKFEPRDQFRTYSDVGTDPRCRVVDTVYVAKDDKWYPKAGDDAMEVAFFKVTELPRLAFNHRKIIDDYLKEKGQLVI